MANPCIRIVGGKRQLLPELMKYVPENFTSYHEVFFGGGALFFALQEKGLLEGKDVYLSDYNNDIVSLHKRVRDDVDGLQTDLSMMMKFAEKEGFETYYYRLRNMLPGPTKTAAARFLWLNRACMNGVVRYNRGGLFNTPIGRNNRKEVVSPVFDADNLRAASTALRGAKIGHMDFVSAFVDFCLKGSFYYCDPPYSGGYTQYTSKGWDEKEDRHLIECCLTAASRGANVMLSSGSYSCMEDLAHQILSTKVSWRVEPVHARRSVNSDGFNRDGCKELIFLIGKAWS